MSTALQSYKQLIVDGIQDLPTDLLVEIADFVYFVRKRATNPDLFATEQYTQLLQQDLQQMSSTEANHLEAEFQDYEHLFDFEATLQELQQVFADASPLSDQARDDARYDYLLEKHGP